MKTRRNHLPQAVQACLLIGAAFVARSLFAQTVGPEYLVSGTVTGHETDQNLECAVAAVRNSSTGNDEVVVGWNSKSTGSGGTTVFYRISKANAIGFLTTAPAQALVLPCSSSGTNSFDPAVATSPATRHMWVGAIAEDTTRRPFFSRKDYGSTTLGPPSDVTNCGTLSSDKPFAVVGPIPGATDNSETMYTTFNPGSGLNLYLRAARSANTPNVGTSWINPVPHITSNDNGDWESGHGAFPVLIPLGASQHVGRLIVGYWRDGPFTPPYWTRSDNGGVEGSWLGHQIVNHYGSAGASLIDDLSQPTFPSRVYIQTWPSLSVDPTSPNKVYMVFAGHAQGAPAGDCDLFVAVSSNFGDSFGTVYRLTSAQLTLPTEPTYGSDPLEFMPSVVVDRNHGINILFQRTVPAATSDQTTTVVVRYARFANDAALTSAPALFDLAGPFALITYTAGAGGNDYHMFASTGCTLYAVYVHPDPVTGIPKVYIRKIQLPDSCISDIDADSLASVADVLLFANAMVSGEPAADANNDGAVTPADVVEFMNNYHP